MVITKQEHKPGQALAQFCGHAYKIQFNIRY